MMLRVCILLTCAGFIFFLSVSGQESTHSVDKRQAIPGPNRTCLKNNNREIFYPSNRDDLVFICREGRWLPYRLTPAIGSTSHTPALSCKEVKAYSKVKGNRCAIGSGLYWITRPRPCSAPSEGPEAVQVYCDLVLDGGGWILVWKHSYMQVKLPLTEQMKYYSNVTTPCTNLDVGWCNMANKARFGQTEMMIVAYHNNAVVYAYKGTFNANIDRDWFGGILFNVTKITDTCTTKNGVKPDPYIANNLGGIAFDKYTPGQYTANCDTISGSLTNPSSCRFGNCGTHGGGQMTMAIYVR